MGTNRLARDERIWTISWNGFPVEKLLDVKGSQTFDPTQAIDVKLSNRSYAFPISENDVITFTMIMDGAHG